MLVDIDNIKENPLNIEVYGSIVPSDIDTLTASIKSLGLLQPLIINKEYTLISGHRRLACLRELEIKKAQCIVKDIDDEEAIVFIIESNRQRVKTARQQLNEAKYLLEYYGNQQGKRNDLVTSTHNVEVGKRTNEKVADEVGTSRGTIQRLMYIDKNYPSLIDNIGNEITLNQAYKEVRQLVSKDMLSKAGKKYKKNGKLKKVQADSYVIYNQSCEDMRQVEDESVQFIFTSPPYHLIRDYGVPGCIGADEDLDVYLKRMMKVMEECWRVMRDDATMFLVYADKYQDGSMLMSHERLIIKMVDYGFKLKNKIVYQKSNPNPEAAQKRFMQNNEIIYFLTKSSYDYKFDMDCFRIEHKHNSPISNAQKHHRLLDDKRIANKSASLKNPLGKVPSSVEVLESFVRAGSRKKDRKNGTEFFELHNSTFPVELVDRFAEAAITPGDICLEPFLGSGTTIESIVKHGGYGIGYELQPQYIEYCKERMAELEV